MSNQVNKDGSRVRGMFAGIAPWYDFLNHLLSLNIDRYWRQRMTVLVPPPAQGSILDVCTGTGDLAIAYHRASKGMIPVTGSDFCLPMLEVARAKAMKSQLNIPFLEADTLALPFSTDEFSLVTVGFGLRNVADTLEGIREMTRVARPGGTVAILEFSRPRGWFLGSLYGFYFRRVLPLLGQVFSRSRDDAYHYLRNSVLQFPDGEQLAALLQKGGLENVQWQPLTFGIASLYWGSKPANK